MAEKRRSVMLPKHRGLLRGRPRGRPNRLHITGKALATRLSPEDSKRWQRAVALSGLSQAELLRKLVLAYLTGIGMVAYDA